MSVADRDEVHVADKEIDLPEGKYIISLGLSCGHGGGTTSGDSGDIKENSIVFEVICFKADQLTVVDIDRKDEDLLTLDDVMPFLQIPGHIATSIGSDDGATMKFSSVKPDAYVITGRGIQIVYLTPNVQHIMQDPAYQRICTERRHWWGMRTHFKMDEEAPSYFGERGTPRKMIGLTESGKLLATEWNNYVDLAIKVRAAREELGFARVVDGFCVPPGYVPTLLSSIS